MDFMAEFTGGMSRVRARKIIKRKRMKRPHQQRSCSPFGTSTTSGSDGDCLIDNSPIEQSPAMPVQTSSKEDEDLANCLIMLAHGVSPFSDKSESDQICQKTEKLSSRVHVNTSDVNATTGKSGLYVYECKTCNRTFQSFQALGGHRASHKKPKVNVEDKKPNSVTEYTEEDEYNHKPNHEEQDDEETKASIINHYTKPKVHECSICGSEFLSGQALGGHMRKHRPVPPSGGGNRTGVSTITDDSSSDQITEKSPDSNTGGGLLTLDLNFPPPDMVEDHRSTFSLTDGSQPRLVFSAPIVDCHY